MNKRDKLRAAAKKLYKEQSKKVPRKQRMPFAQFFKNYTDAMNRPNPTDENETEEDFNFDDLVNMNELSEDTPESDEDTEEEI